jgi:hypothetical protein
MVQMMKISQSLFNKMKTHENNKTTMILKYRSTRVLEMLIFAKKFKHTWISWWSIKK